MAEKEFIRRTGEVRVKLAPDMLGRLEELATSYGFPVATMAAVAVAEWVNGKDLAQKNQRMLLMDIGRQMSGEAAKIFGAIADDPQALMQAEAIARKAQDQLTLSLDGKGAVGG